MQEDQLVNEQLIIGFSPYLVYGRNNNLPLYSTTDNRTFVGLNVKDRSGVEQAPVERKFSITAIYSFRPDLISYKFYQNPLLGWYICEYNEIVNPYDEETGLYIGRLISIPSKTRLVTEQF